MKRLLATTLVLGACASSAAQPFLRRWDRQSAHGVVALRLRSASLAPTPEENSLASRLIQAQCPATYVVDDVKYEPPDLWLWYFRCVGSSSGGQ